MPRVLPAFTMVAIVLVVSAGRPHAFEPGQHPPYMAGLTGGVPIGVLPPPAFYLSNLDTWGGGPFNPDSRPKHPDSISVFSQGLTFLWVPDLTLLWGARYGAYVQQAVVEKTVTGLPPHGVTESKSGLANTTISPVNLAWVLPSDFYVSTRFNFFPPNGQYSRNDPVNIANNFWAFEPNIGISYLRGGFDLSLHLVYDIVSENQSTNTPGSVHGRYHSGNVFSTDYSASQSFGQWRFGVTGYGVQQVRDDSTGGKTLDGTKTSKVGIGPLVEYNISWLGVNLYYVRDLSWRGAFGGNNVFLRATVKF